MYFSRFTSVVVMVLLLTGCISEEKYNDMLIFMMPEEVKTLADHTVKLVAEKDYIAISSLLHDELKTEDINQKIVDTLRYIPKGNLMETIISGYKGSTIHSMRGSTVKNHIVNYQMKYSEGWMLLTLSFREGSAGLKITALSINIIPDDLRKIHAFDLSHAGAIQIIFLAAVGLFPAFIVFSLYHAFKIRKSLMRPKRWLIFIALGFGSLSLNWTNGVVTFQFISIGLLGAAGMTAGPFSPWFFTIYFPIGAALFWILRKSGKLGLRIEHEETGENNVEPEATEN